MDRENNIEQIISVLEENDYMVRENFNLITGLSSFRHMRNGLKFVDVDWYQVEHDVSQIGTICLDTILVALAHNLEINYV